MRHVKGQEEGHFNMGHVNGQEEGHFNMGCEKGQNKAESHCLNGALH